jgi:hypothetical protein
MKIILSRKGFDSAHGGIASPVSGRSFMIILRAMFTNALGKN